MYVQGMLSYATGTLAQLSDSTITALRLVMHDNEIKKIAPNFLAGSKVRIADGPFSGLSGVVLQSLDDSARIRVLLSMFGREVRVALPEAHLQAQ